MWHSWYINRTLSLHMDDSVKIWWRQRDEAHTQIYCDQLSHIDPFILFICLFFIKHNNCSTLRYDVHLSTQQCVLLVFQGIHNRTNRWQSVFWHTRYIQAKEWYVWTCLLINHEWDRARLSQMSQSVWHEYGTVKGRFQYSNVASSFYPQFPAENQNWLFKFC